MVRALGVALLATTSMGQVSGREPIVGLPCEGCEAVFQGLPATIAMSARIAPLGEPGAPMIIRGRVTTASGSPAPGIVVYAYQTDARGVYPTPNGFAGAASRHGRLRGWARTGPDGDYRFDTIRPAPYPGEQLPAHVHLHVIEPGRQTYYIDDLMFDDDPLLTQAARERLTLGRGGNGIMRPIQDANGVWQARRDIVLGRRIPGYR